MYRAFIFLCICIPLSGLAEEDLSYYQVSPNQKTAPSQEKTLPTPNVPEKAYPLKKKQKKELKKTDDYIFKIKEHHTNYAISGDPDTKIQFSFKFNLIKGFDLFLGYTQVMFWDLEEESRPFTDVNYNPELFYNLKLKSSYFNNIHIGYDHNSNGKAGLESRSYDSAYIRLIAFEEFSYGIPRVHIKLRQLIRLDETNEDIRSFYGPVVVKFFFDKLGKKLFRSEELYLEYYAGDRFADIAKRSSFRVSCRFKLFNTPTAPKLFFQYFSGYGENLASYNKRDETFRAGISLGGL